MTRGHTGTSRSVDCESGRGEGAPCQRATAAAAAGWAVAAAPALTLLWLAAVGLTGPPAALAEPDRDDIREAEAQLREIETRHQRAVEEYLQAETRLDGVDADIDETEARLDELADRTAEREAGAAQVMRQLYTGRSAASTVAMFDASDLTEASRRAAYLEFTQRSHRATLEAYRTVRADLNHETESLRAARAEAAELREELAARAERIDADAEAQQDELASLRAQVAEREERERERAAQQAAERAAQRAAEEEAAQEEAAGSEPEPEVADRGGDVQPASRSDSDDDGGGGGQAPATSDAASVAVEAALSQRGQPYQWGAQGPDRFDCSGLTMWAWRQAGVNIPRTSRQQYAALPKVSRSELQPGDLVFFGSPIHHMGMYIGNGQMVEAPYTGEVVRTRDINRSDYAGAARPGG